MYPLVFTTLGKISYFPLALNASSTYASWHHNMLGQKACSAFAVGRAGISLAIFKAAETYS